MRLSTLKLKGTALVIAGIVGLAACNASSGGTQLASDQVLRFALASDINTLDPAFLSTLVDVDLARNLFNGPLKFNDDGSISPDLLESMPDISSDGLVYTLKIRNDAQFWTGKKVTADDFIYSWDRAAAGGGDYASVFDVIKGFKETSNSPTGGPVVHLAGVEKVNDQTLKITLSKKAGYFLSEMAIWTMWIVDKDVVSKDSDNWWRNPDTANGTGAFRLTRRDAAHLMEFGAVGTAEGNVSVTPSPAASVSPSPKAFVDPQYPARPAAVTVVNSWWGTPKPTLKKVSVEIGITQDSQVTKYKQGGYDVIGYANQNLGKDNLRQLQSDPKYKDQVKILPSVRSTWVGFGFKGGPFAGSSQKAKDLRMALILSIDQKKLVDTACANATLCSVADGGLIAKGLDGNLGSGNDPLAKTDIPKAQQLLAGAGGADALKGVKYGFNNDSPLNVDVFSNLQSQWKDNLGVDIQPDGLDFATFKDNRNKFKYSLFRHSWSADYNSPQDWYDFLFRSGAGSSGSGYSNPTFDSTLSQADQVPYDQAKDQYKQLNQLLIDDAAYKPLFYDNQRFVIQSYVDGAGASNFYDYYWTGVKIRSH